MHPLSLAVGALLCLQLRGLGAARGSDAWKGLLEALAEAQLGETEARQIAAHGVETAAQLLALAGDTAGLKGVGLKLGARNRILRWSKAATHDLRPAGKTAAVSYAPRVLSATTCKRLVDLAQTLPDVWDTLPDSIDGPPTPPLAHLAIPAWAYLS